MVDLPTFDPDELLALALGERAVREAEPAMSREEVLEKFDIDVEG